MTNLEHVDRARSVIGKKCIYKLGAGGMDPNRIVPWDSKLTCDCSGFVSWCLGISRRTTNQSYVNINGGWIETTAIDTDIHTSIGLGKTGGLFEFIAWYEAFPGCIVVYGDRDGHQGHIGIIGEVLQSGPSSVIHCSSGNYKRTGDAIQETDLSVFIKNNAVIWEYIG